MRYLNIPSSYPLTREEAIVEAIGRDIDTDRLAGIIWQGDHGSENHLDWCDMTYAEREKLGVE